MKCLKIAAILVLCMFLFSVAYAHPGGTDGRGGHYVGGSDEYHYHHGYSAHDHWDMDDDGYLECPYDSPDVNHGKTKTAQAVDDIVEYLIPFAISFGLLGIVYLKDKFF